MTLESPKLLRLASICVLLFILDSCKTIKPDYHYITSDTVNFELQAINLSEDMTSLATGNDEILLSFLSTDSIPRLIEKWYHIFESRNSYFQFKFDKGSHDQVLCVFVEYDSDRSLDSVAYDLEINIDSALVAFDRRDYKLIEEIIGDEDILGYKMINIQRSDSVRVTGIHKFDKYEYMLRWSD
ncbi:MAG: hypothetical protein NXI20_09305 [bacterium]|nr:hypothetical protein [bacterium]